MKFALASAAILILALLIWKRRKRLGLALNVAAIGYGLLFFIRVIQSRDTADRWWDVALGLSVIGGAWVVIWIATTGVLWYRRRKARRRDHFDGSGDDSAARSAMADR